MFIIDLFSIFICITMFEYINIYIYMPVNTVYIYIICIWRLLPKACANSLYIYIYISCVQYYGLHTHVIPYGDDLKSNVLVSLQSSEEAKADTCF